MATTSFTVDSTAYVEVTDVNALIQNKSPWPLYIVFSETLPLVGTDAYHVLVRYQAILKANEVPTGKVYARSGREGWSNLVSVSPE